MYRRTSFADGTGWEFGILADCMSRMLISGVSMTLLGCLLWSLRKVLESI